MRQSIYNSDWVRCQQRWLCAYLLDQLWFYSLLQPLFLLHCLLTDPVDHSSFICFISRFSRTERTLKVVKVIADLKIIFPVEFIFLMFQRFLFQIFFWLVFRFFAIKFLWYLFNQYNIGYNFVTRLFYFFNVFSVVSKLSRNRFASLFRFIFIICKVPSTSYAIALWFLTQ